MTPVLGVAPQPRPTSLPAVAARTRPFGARAVEVAAAVGMIAVAALLRWPYLWEIPRFTDELQEVNWSLNIALGQALPLTAVDSYYGPLWSYLLAGLFRLFGPSPYLPRMAALLLGSSLVALTYFFA